MINISFVGVTDYGLIIAAKTGQGKFFLCFLICFGRRLDITATKEQSLRQPSVCTAMFVKLEKPMKLLKMDFSWNNRLESKTNSDNIQV